MKRLNVLGLEVLPQVTGAQSEGKYFIFKSSVLPGMGVGPHIHHLEDEIVHLVKGEMEVFFQGQFMKVQAGATCYFPRLTAHGFTNKSQNNAEVVFFVSPAGNFEKFFGELNDLPPGAPDMKKVFEIFAKYKIDIINQ